MCSRGPAPSGVPVLVGLGYAHHVLPSGFVLAASIFVAEVADIVAFSNAKPV